jgi:hypothetical protein
MTAGWVLFHEHQVDDSLRRQLRSALPRQEARRFGSDVIFELPPTLPASGLPPVLDLSGTRAPVAGQLLSVPLFAPTNTAMMLGPAQLPDVTLIWPGPDGLPHQGKVILRGTVLLDRGDKVLVARLLKAPRDDEPGEAVLAGRELVAQAVGP